MDRRQDSATSVRPPDPCVPPAALLAAACPCGLISRSAPSTDPALGTLQGPRALGWAEFESSAVTPITSAAGSPGLMCVFFLKTAVSVLVMHPTLHVAGKSPLGAGGGEGIFQGQEMIQFLLKPPAPF